jgi:hypothetical protein
MDARLGLDPALYAPARLVQVDPERVSDDAAIPQGEAFAVCRVLPVDEAGCVKTAQAAT